MKRASRLGFYVILFIFIAGLNVFAQNIGNSSVTVQADNMRYFSEQKKSTFTGNVVAISDQYVLTANVVDVYFMEKNQINEVRCKGNVNFKTDDLMTISDKADLNQITKTIKLTGNVKIWQDDSYIEGENVQIQYETKEIYIDKGGKSNVTVIFNPAAENTEQQ